MGLAGRLLTFITGGCVGWLVAQTGRRHSQTGAADAVRGLPPRDIKASVMLKAGTMLQMHVADIQPLRSKADPFDLAKELNKPEYQPLADRLLTLNDIDAFWTKAEAAIAAVREAIRTEMAAHPEQYDSLFQLQDQFRRDVNALTGQLDAILPTIMEVRMAYAATVAVSGRMQAVAKEEPAFTSAFNKVNGVVGAMNALAGFAKA